MNNIIKKAFIFAAGRGERMGELTKHLPKPLLTVANKPLIVYTIERLRDAGIEEIIVNLAYHGDKIEQALGNGSEFGVVIEYSYEPYPLETGGALWKARDLIGDETVLVTNADVWTDYPFRALQQTNLLTGDVAHLIMVPNPPQHQQGDFLLTDKNRLELTEHAMPRGRVAGVAATYSGFGLFSPQLIGDYPHCREKFPLREVFEFFIQQNKISAELYVGQWQDIGTPQRLAALNKKFS